MSKRSDDPFSGPAEKSFGDIVNGRYYFPNPVTGRPCHTTRVTGFAKSISDTYLLSLWQQRMTAKGLTLRPDLFARAASLDVKSDRNLLNEVVEKAKEAAGSGARANLGSALHSFTEAYDRGENPKVPPPWDRDLAAYVKLCEQEGLEPLPEMIERTVWNDTFGLVGTLDRAVSHGGTRRILDLKTGTSLDWGWNEIAVQLYAYASADYVWNVDLQEWEKLEPFDCSEALVIHLPVGEATAHLYRIDLGLGEAGAHLCKSVRAWRGKKSEKPIATVSL